MAQHDINGRLSCCKFLRNIKMLILHLSLKNLIENLSKTPEALCMLEQRVLNWTFWKGLFFFFFWLSFVTLLLIGTEIWQVPKVPQHRENGHTRECKIWWKPRYSLNPVLGFIITFNVVLRCHNSCPQFFFNMQRAISFLNQSFF